MMVEQLASQQGRIAEHVLGLEQAIKLIFRQWPASRNPSPDYPQAGRALARFGGPLQKALSRIEEP